MATEIGSGASQPAQSDIAVKDKPGKPPGQPGIIHSLNHLANGIDYALAHPFSSVINDLRGIAGILTGNGAAVNASANRVMGWVQNTPLASLKAWVRRQIARLRTQMNNDFISIVKIIFDLQNLLIAYINRLIRSETHYRKLGDLAAERYARNQVTALHHLIERESASAYRGSADQRLTVIERILNLVASRNPVVRGLVRIAVAGLLDLLSVDNPPARILLGFVMRRVIDRLGVDQAAAGLASDLLGPLLGNPRPHDLPGVIRDVSGRLGALEGQWAQFYERGGSDVEQAGSQWAALTSPVADLALIAWLGQAVIDPQSWARDVSDVVLPIASGVQDAFTAITNQVR